jgi:hypothetical protein
MVTSVADAPNTTTARLPKIITKTTIVRLQGKDLLTRSTFHDTFATKLHFPSYYGRNMDAWIDVMSNGDYIPESSPQSSLDVSKDTKDVEIQSEMENGIGGEVLELDDCGEVLELDDWGEVLGYDDCGERGVSICLRETLVMIIVDGDEFLKSEMEKELRECVEFINEKRAGFEMLKIVYE